MNNKFMIGVSFLLAFTVLQANAGTYCGMLGDQKIELDSEYFSLMPDYEGTSPWEPTKFKPNEDCSSKLTLLSARTNINTGKPTKGSSEETFDIVIFYEPGKDNGFLSRYSASLGEDADFNLINDSADKKVYEKINVNSFNMRNVERNTVYLDDGKVTEILKCGFNTTTKRNWCDLHFYSETFNVKIFGNYESLHDFSKARKFAVEFINEARIKK
jgi:hypothetical protein